ncbi:helix-turn-helix domain-containing protein [Actinokineospora pegani]|uniref:helix-turn-helix domain-containing protein n=1 Tax=Actinokineospora pegani TaxID=2654637 RepID=UPI0018D4C85C|nr:helix-turn-helix transcriptional regulator [Actinokineospora pegani]
MSTAELDPLVARVLFGSILGAARTTAVLSQAAVAERTGIAAERVANLEQGRSAPTPDETESFVALYDLPKDRATELRDYGAIAADRAPVTGSAGRRRNYAVYERAASEIQMVYPCVPGLLQTHAYAFAQIRRSPVVSPATADERAQARADRGAAVMARTDCRLSVVIGEEALHREIGGRDALREQLKRVLDFVALDHVNVQVFPWSAGETSGLSSSFTILSIAQGLLRLAYTEALTGTSYSKRLGAFVEAFEDARERSLSPEDSRRLLERRINDL